MIISSFSFARERDSGSTETLASGLINVNSLKKFLINVTVLVLTGPP